MSRPGLTVRYFLAAFLSHSFISHDIGDGQAIDALLDPVTDECDGVGDFRERHVGENAPARFDPAGDRQRVPEALTESLPEQELGLGLTGKADPGKQG